MLMMLLGALSGGCARDEEANASETATMELPDSDSLPTSTDAVVTQTVDLGDTDRSPAEGEGVPAEPPTRTSNPGKAKTRP